MITSPPVSVLRNTSSNPIWESCGKEKNVSLKTNKPFVHPVPPSDPQRQANRLPIKILKMLTARAGHILHPEYLQPLPSTPVSPIEVRLFFFTEEGYNLHIRALYTPSSPVAKNIIPCNVSWIL